MTAQHRMSEPMTQPDEDVMLDGRYDPAFALYFTQRDDEMDLPSWGLVIFCLVTFACLGGTFAFLAL